MPTLCLLRLIHSGYHKKPLFMLISQKKRRRRRKKENSLFFFYWPTKTNLPQIHIFPIKWWLPVPSRPFVLLLLLPFIADVVWRCGDWWRVFPCSGCFCERNVEGWDERGCEGWENPKSQYDKYIEKLFAFSFSVVIELTFPAFAFVLLTSVFLLRFWVENEKQNKQKEKFENECVLVFICI